MRESGWGRPSLPSASGTAPAAASAAGPPLDPPAPRSASRGLRVGPCLTDSVEKLITISGTVVSPRVTSPAARNRAIRSVSRRATALRMLRLPSENGTPAAKARQVDYVIVDTAGRL